MSRKSPAFSFYPDSWIGGTSLMTDEERGVYIQLLAINWLQGSLSFSHALAITFARDSAIVERVLNAKFRQDENGNWFNERLEDERKKQFSRSQNGVKGSEKRWGNGKHDGKQHGKTYSKHDGKPHGKRDGKTMHSDSDSVSDSITDTESERESSPSVIWMIPETFKTQEFCQLWESRCKKFLTTEGRPLDEVQGNAELMELCRRGYQNAVKDLQTTVLKGYGRTICEHDKFGDQEKTKSKKPLFGTTT